MVPSVKEKIASFKSQLEEAEREVVLDISMATMHGQQANQPKARLGQIQIMALETYWHFLIVTLYPLVYFWVEYY